MRRRGSRARCSTPRVGPSPPASRTCTPTWASTSRRSRGFRSSPATRSRRGSCCMSVWPGSSILRYSVRTRVSTCAPGRQNRAIARVSLYAHATSTSLGRTRIWRHVRSFPSVRERSAAAASRRSVPSRRRKTSAARLTTSSGRGLKTVVQVESWSAAIEAIKAGAAAITQVPGGPIPDAPIAALRAHQALWIPTLSVHAGLADFLGNEDLLDNPLLEALTRERLHASYVFERALPPIMRMQAAAQRQKRPVYLASVARAARRPRQPVDHSRVTHRRHREHARNCRHCPRWPRRRPRGAAQFRCRLHVRAADVPAPLKIVWAKPAHPS